MRAPCLRPILCLALGSLGCWVAVPGTSAEIYKCQQPDGQIDYRQTPCDDGRALTVDTRSPGGSAANATDRDYSVTTQAQEMQTQREQQSAQREREWAQQRAASASRLATTERDQAKCFKQRAEVAKWEQRASASYRTREERDENENTLAHHRSLVERYCE